MKETSEVDISKGMLFGYCLECGDQFEVTLKEMSAFLNDSADLFCAKCNPAAMKKPISADGREVRIRCSQCGQLYSELKTWVMWCVFHPSRSPTCIECDTIAEVRVNFRPTEKGEAYLRCR